MFCVDAVHVCRSGCWTAPWLDLKFLKFVEDSKLQPFKLQTGIWDAMQLRWSEEDIKELLEMERKMQEMRNEMVNQLHLRK
jgi:hypothetical protein